MNKFYLNKKSNRLTEAKVKGEKQVVILTDKSMIDFASFYAFYLSEGFTKDEAIRKAK